MILSLDPGVVSGFAFEDGRTGVFDTSKSEMGQACALFQDWLEANLGSVTLVAVERPFFVRHSHQATLTEWLIGHTHSMCWSKGIERVEYTADAVRGWLLGSRRKLKVNGVKETTKAFDARIRAAVEAAGFVVPNEHAADAAALLLFARDTRDRATKNLHDFTGHTRECEFHVDQYPWECTCGRVEKVA